MAAHIRVESSTSNSSGRNSPPNASAAPSIFLDGTKTPTNPFATPLITSPLPSEKSASGYFPRVNAPRRRFKSSRLVGEYEKPWINDSKRKVNWDSVIFYIGVVIALGVGAVICWLKIKDIPQQEASYNTTMTLIRKTLDKNVWNHEIQMNGFGTGSFDWTTDDSANSYVDAKGLHIVPTMTLESTDITYGQLTNGYTVNLTKSGTCTSRDQRVSEQRVNEWVRSQPCAAVSNSTKGTIINPVRSARLTTAGNKMIKYGKVEVVAKMPKGDWMWPAIWMMPQDSVYGEWPKSGEIDIAESRGNDAETYPLGDHIVSSALHWGTSYLNDAWYKSYGEWGGKRTKYSEGFHTYSLEWSEKYLFTWLDGRLRQIVFFDFTKNRNMWTYGEFWRTAVNNTTPEDPWTQTGRSNTPFDQRFYLILNVAVGGTQGWFPDGMGTKPWADGSDTPMKDFWKANSTWLPTWGPVEDRGMIVKSVKMWQEGAC
ncbi:glycosyl hydrolase family [Fusarium albosuccineum]|uniref:Glycosyl hydrolase family n=1 Tax=Fusarium albosuccineum TaxID=1237068 RepID=A0A8H4LJH7_9HYPO|nr:glycosyl hydrolase family [Fusarium albosuccineum]